MSILAKVREVIEGSRRKRAGAQAVIERAVKALAKLEELKPEVAKIRHHGISRVRRLEQERYLGEICARTFFEVALEVARKLREGGKVVSEEGLRWAIGSSVVRERD